MIEQQRFDVLRGSVDGERHPIEGSLGSGPPLGHDPRRAAGGSPGSRRRQPPATADPDRTGPDPGQLGSASLDPVTEDSSGPALGITGCAALLLVVELRILVGLRLLVSGGGLGSSPSVRR